MLSEHFFNSGQELASALASATAARLREALTARSKASLVVSGGRTPADFLGALSAHELDWSAVSVLPTDDRWVDIHHADSNEAMIRRQLLRNAATTAVLHGLSDAALDPEPEGERHAEAMLKNLSMPFDVVVLGMGDDGHTASLFPQAPQLAKALDLNSGRRCMILDPMTAPHRRISLTLPALLQSRQIDILIRGDSKLNVYRRALSAGPTMEMPISFILDQKQVPVHVYWSP
ncbi:MAG: 6-phosphogluconolactonase [Pseudomonadota bacterium]